MTRRLPALCAAVAVAAGAVLATTASAHYPEVEASFDCTDNVVHATLRASSWVTGDTDRRTNAKIELRWDGTLVGTGAFTAANGFAFTLPYTTVPDGKTHVVTATAAVGFGPD